MNVVAKPELFKRRPSLGRGYVLMAGDAHWAAQGPSYLPAISAETVDSKALWFGMIVLQAGSRTKAHVHEDHETALYMLSGSETELWTGDRLQHFEAVRPGMFVFIPKNVLHVAVNRGPEPAVFIASRNEPTAQESVVLYPEYDVYID